MHGARGRDDYRNGDMDPNGEADDRSPQGPPGDPVIRDGLNSL